MSGLCGWAGWPYSKSVLEAMAARLTAFDHSSIFSLAGENFALATAATSGRSVYQDKGIAVVISGQPKWTPQNLHVRAVEEGLARTIASEYSRRSIRLLADLEGAYALALFREPDELMLAIDRMGIYSLHYSALADGPLIFGSNALSLNKHPLVRPEINKQNLFNYVYFHMVPGPSTIFKNQQRLAAGHYLLRKNGATTSAPYWEMKFVEDVPASEADLTREFRKILRAAVEARAQPHTGAFLSGGTDSSTIAGVLTEVTGAPAATYSIGFDAPGYDEMEYARLAARHFSTNHHEYYVTPQDVVNAIPQIAAIYDQPFGNASAVPTFYCAKMAKADGITTLLGGDGGDELFGGNERYGKQHLFSLYGAIPAPLRSRLIEPATRKFRGPLTGIGLGKALSYIEQAATPMPERMETYNLLNRLGAEKIFHEDFLGEIDIHDPIMQLRSIYQRARAKTLINRMLATDLKFTLADNDLPKVTRMCELAGVGSEFPLLDDALVAFSARLRPKLKLKGTQLRYFFKAALSDFLPKEIIQKSKHGFGLPFGLWLQSYAPLRELANDSLNDLKAHQLIRPEFIDELKDVHLTAHASYYGTLIWVLMMLEQWHKNHIPART